MPANQIANRFRFRVWETEEKRWGNDAYLECCGPELKHILFHDKPERYVIEQSTGLLDKNGWEVFEGDIIRFSTSDLAYEIKWTLLQGFVAHHIDTVTTDEDGVISERGHFFMTWQWDCYDAKERDFEVLGNIHEHSHLLAK